MEEWRDIPGYEGRYKVSDLGRVQSLQWRGRKAGGARLLKPQANTRGYLFVYIRDRPQLIHRLVMLAFVGDSGGAYVNHKNGVPTDNNLGNLEYCTPSENSRHAVHVLGKKPADGRGGRKKGDPAPWKAKLTADNVREIKRKLASGSKKVSVAKDYGVSPSTIYSIATGQEWAHIS